MLGSGDRGRHIDRTGQSKRGDLHGKTLDRGTVRDTYHSFFQKHLLPWVLGVSLQLDGRESVLDLVDDGAHQGQVAGLKAPVAPALRRAPLQIQVIGVMKQRHAIVTVVVYLVIPNPPPPLIYSSSSASPFL
jgi:hypothetical protein